MKTIPPAIAEHVMEENERLREALKFALVTMSATAKSERLAGVERRSLLAEAARIEAALSQQAEPAPAQDDLLPCPFCGGKVREPVQHGEGHRIVCHCGVEYSGLVAAPSDLIRCWNRRGTRPAQTEQQPIRLPQRADTSHGDAFDTQLAEAYNAALDEVARLNAAPIAQAATQPVAYADPQALANFEVARKNGHTSGPYCSEWMHAHQWRGEIPLFDAPQPIAAEGWRLVPVEPNEAIRDAIDLLCDDHAAFDDSDAFWHYLLAATPSPA